MESIERTLTEVPDWFFTFAHHYIFMEKPELSVGICAYNEEKNIGELLKQILGARLESAQLREVLVVSSGSTDRTDEIVRNASKQDARIKLLQEEKRKGKTSAVNLISKHAEGDIIVLSGADILLEGDVLEKLVARFADQDIGMAGARPVPVNDRSTLCGFCSHLLWEMHHRISLESPKCGEFIAFRNRGYIIPEGIGADEAFLESCFTKEGDMLAYVPEAIVRNRGPGTIQDYITQRRRIHAQHMHLRRETGYAVSSSKPIILARALCSSIKLDARSLLFLPIAVALEAFSVMLGAYDLHLGKNQHSVWEVAKSTKEIP
jgi:glycosyltransferase involved in cell wall biosynthesis